MLKYISLALGALVLFIPSAIAQEERFSIGGDEFAAANQSVISSPVANDAFAAGFNVRVSAPVTGDAHAAGFTVDVEADVGGDVYAAGNSVTISGRIGHDVTAAGGSISVTGSRGIAGNVRLAGGGVTLAAPVAGSAVIAAGMATLDAPVTGDFVFTGDKLSFSNNALVLGKVDIYSTSEIDVPQSVADPDRVSFHMVEHDEIGSEVQDIAQKSVKGFWLLAIPAIVCGVIVLVVGILWLALFPERGFRSYDLAMSRPWKSFFFGMASLAGFIGLIPVTAMTIIGIPLTPVAVIVLLLAGLVGYIAGVWFVATRVLLNFGFEPSSLGRRVLALIAGLVVALVLGAIPFVGWLFHLGLIFFGLGALMLSAFAGWLGRDPELLPAPPPASRNRRRKA